MRHLTLLSVLVLCPLAAGCAPTAEATALPVRGVNPPPSEAAPAETTITASLGSQFQLAFGQTATLPEEDLAIQFVQVVDDSRCPSDVACIWAGQVTVRLRVTEGGQDQGNVDLTLSPNPNPKATATSSPGGYWFIPIDVAPYPQSSGEILMSDYVVTLVVTRVVSR